MFSSTHFLELAAIVVAGTMVGNEFAVAIFFHPRISALDDATHVRAAQALAAALGRAMPFWYALTFLLSGAIAFFARPAGTPGHGLALAAAGLFAAMIVYTVVLPVPINNQVARWRPESLPTNWRELRRRWDTLHAVRVGVLLVALVLLVTSCLLPPVAQHGAPANRGWRWGLLQVPALTLPASVTELEFVGPLRSTPLCKPSPSWPIYNF